MAESTPDERISERNITTEMKEAYLRYSMSVIVGRALPDARDGLKPVHRRVLYTMYENSIFHNKPFKKSAFVVGNCMAKYHPHGDSAIYDTLIRLAQDFSMRYPLVQGQGNFGSIDGDAAAAMRYTEARLSKVADEILQDIDKETVPFVPNFDGSVKEPDVLPSKIPNLLLNGSSGIAVGMATNIPPHNFTELADGVCHLIDNPDATVDELMQFVTGPDFPTGGIICGNANIKRAYGTGRGKITVRGKLEVEELKNKSALIIKEIPYQVNKSQLVMQIASLVRDKVIHGITDIRDESDRDGMRVVLELKSNENPELVQNLLFKHTRLQVTFGILSLALVNKEPKVLPLKDMIQIFIDHRFTMITNRTKFELKKAEERAHILAGLIIALEDIDSIITLLKKSPSPDAAKKGLVSDFSLTEKQAQAILEMRLSRLTSLEQEKIRKEHEELLIKIKNYKDILGSRERVLEIIKTETNEAKGKYGDSRKTEIIESEDSELEIEDLIADEEVVVTISHAGYAKRITTDTYRQQKRGGKGIIAAGTKEEDFIEHLFVARTHSFLLLFTDKGKVHWTKVFQLPSAGRAAKGVPLVNLVNLDKGETITAFVVVDKFEDNDSRSLVMATEKGVVKRSSLSHFSNPRRGGILAISLHDSDKLIGVLLTSGEAEVVLATRNGNAIRFAETDVREMGRTAAGVRGIKLKGEDRVIGMIRADDSRSLLTITKNGFGKRTPFNEYRRIGRGGTGVINIKVTSKNQVVVSVLSVSETDDVMFISKNGVIIRTAASGISTIGRNTQGLRLMRIGESDSVISAAKVSE